MYEAKIMFELSRATCGDKALSHEYLVKGEKLVLEDFSQDHAMYLDYLMAKIEYFISSDS